MRPLEREGSVKPRSFCLSLKFASIERYNVLIQLKRGGQFAVQHTLGMMTYWSTEEVIKFFPGCRQAGQSIASEPGVRALNRPSMWAPPPQ